MADRMRLTAHNGRSGKHGVYSPKHNDRNFSSAADHIDEGRSRNNWYWHCYQSKHPDMTFEDAEALYYEQHFREALDARNERNIKARHTERVRTMDEYRSSQRTCPEEQIMQIGRDGQTVDPATLQKIAIEQINWEQKRFPGFRLLDVALHVDEEGAPHIHKRGVWVAHDDAGREVVGQAKALDEMGINAPDPSKKYGKYNNAKMSYTKECREHLFEVAREHGLDLERKPKERSKSGLSLEEYQARQEEERARQAQKALDEARAALDEAKAALTDIGEKQQELATIEAQVAEASVQLEKLLNMKARASIIKKPSPFSKDRMVTYHEKSLESVESLGREAREYMERAGHRLQEVAQREIDIERKKQEVEPLYEKARRYAEAQEAHIHAEAQRKFDNFLEQEFGPTGPKTGRTARLENFCDTIRLSDGTTVLDAFKQQEQHRKARLTRAWKEKDFLN